MTYLDYLEQKVLLERLVIGLEEPVLIKGLGELSAKIDSGNGGYNVIHGTDFHQQGSELMFTTQDSFGHDKKMQAKIIDTIEVNMGGGNIESRPVIELDIKFAGEDYKKIPFSVSDRSSNTNPILISKGFVENELEALIDVGAMNISHEGRDVVYGESWLKGGDNVDLFSPVKKVKDGVTGAVSGVINGAKNLVTGTYNAGKTLAQDGANVVGGLYNAGKNVVGDGAGITKGLYNAGKTVTSDLWNAGEKVAGAIGGIAGLVAATGITAGGIKLISSLAKKISFAPNLTKGDTKEIKTRIASTSDWVKFLKDNKCTKGTFLETENSLNPSTTKMLPIVSFSCQKGIINNNKAKIVGKLLGLNEIPSSALKKTYVQGQEGRAESWKKQIEAAKKGIEYMRNQKAAKGDSSQTEEENEEELLKLSEAFEMLLTEADNQTQQPDTTASQPDAEQADVNAEQTASPEATETVESQDTSEQQEIITNFDDLGMFQLWFISTATAEDAIEYVSKTFIASSNFDQSFGKLYEGGKVTKDAVGSVIKEISSQIKKSKGPNKVKLSGIWCLALSPDSQNPQKRDYHFFQQEPYLIYTNDYEIDSSLRKDNKEIKESVQNAFNTVFPQFNTTYSKLEQELSSNPVNLVKKILKGQLFKKELAETEYFPTLISSISKFRKIAQYQLKNPQAKQKEVLQELSTKVATFIQPFFQEYPRYELSKTDFGRNLLELISQNGTFQSNISNADDLVNIITNIPKASDLLIQEAENTKKAQAKQEEDNKKKEEAKRLRQEKKKKKEEEKRKQEEEIDPDSEWNAPTYNPDEPTPEWDEEEPVDEELDPWVEEKLALLKSKGII